MPNPHVPSFNGAIATILSLSALAMPSLSGCKKSESPTQGAVKLDPKLAQDNLDVLVHRFNGIKGDDGSIIVQFRVAEVAFDQDKGTVQENIDNDRITFHADASVHKKGDTFAFSAANCYRLDKNVVNHEVERLTENYTLQMEEAKRYLGDSKQIFLEQNANDSAEMNMKRIIVNWGVAINSMNDLSVNEQAEFKASSPWDFQNIQSAFSGKEK